MIKSIFLVALGGLGSVLRFLINVLIAKNIPSKLYLATLAVNIIGCLFIGLLIGYFSKNENDTLKLLLVTGFCGGFTTFSTFGLENFSFIQSGNIINALLYTTVSLIIGILFVGFGIYLVK